MHTQIEGEEEGERKKERERSEKCLGQPFSH